MLLNGVVINFKTIAIWLMSYFVAWFCTYLLISADAPWKYIQPFSFALTLSFCAMYFVFMFWSREPYAEQLKGHKGAGFPLVFSFVIPLLLSFGIFGTTTLKGIGYVSDVGQNFIAFALALSFCLGDFFTALNHNRKSLTSYGKAIWILAYLDFPFLVAVSAVLAMSLFPEGYFGSDMKGWSVGATGFQILAQNFAYVTAESIRIVIPTSAVSAATFVPIATSDQRQEIASMFLRRIGSIPNEFPEKMQDIVLWIIKHISGDISERVAAAFGGGGGIEVTSDEQIELSFECLCKYRKGSFIEPAISNDINMDWTEGWFKFLARATENTCEINYYIIASRIEINQRKENIIKLCKLQKRESIRFFIVQKETLISSIGNTDLQFGCIEFYDDGVMLKYWQPTGVWSDMNRFPLRVLDYKLDPQSSRLIKGCKQWGRPILEFCEHGEFN